MSTGLRLVPPPAPDPAPDDSGPPLPFARGLASALPDFALALGFLVTRIRPELTTPGTVRWLLLVILLEFIVIHSAAFMGSVAFDGRNGGRAGGALLALTLFYSLFAGAFALAFHSWWPLLSFWVLAGNRATAVLLTPPDADARLLVRAGWAGTCVCYLAGAMLTTLLPLPRFGFTTAVIATLHLPSSGLWISQPWRPMAFGALYFAAVGILELNGFRAFQGAVPRDTDASRRTAA